MSNSILGKGVLGKLANHEPENKLQREPKSRVPPQFLPGVAVPTFHGGRFLIWKDKPD